MTLIPITQLSPIQIKKFTGDYLASYIVSDAAILPNVEYSNLETNMQFIIASVENTLTEIDELGFFYVAIYDSETEEYDVMMIELAPAEFIAITIVVPPGFSFAILDDEEEIIAIDSAVAFTQGQEYD